MRVSEKATPGPGRTGRRTAPLPLVEVHMWHTELASGGAVRRLHFLHEPNQ